MTQPVLSTQPPCDFGAMLAASEDVRWRSIVKFVYQADFGARGLRVHRVTPVTDRRLQASSVDYSVTLDCPHDSSIFQQHSFCELKSESFPSARISVETFSDVAKGKVGWAFKPPGIVTSQYLLTVFRDGWCFFIGLERYQNWLAKNKARLLSLADENPDYIRFRHTSKGTGGAEWTSEGVAVPTAELVNAFGTSCWYLLPSPLKEIAQDCIDKGRAARRGGIPNAS